MKTPPRKPAGEPAKSQRDNGAPESRQSNETFPRRTAPPGASGLANEARPGLGTRRDETAPVETPKEETSNKVSGEGNVSKRQRSSLEPNDKPLPKDPQEQPPDSWAHEAERSTGVSGHTGGE